ncbi:MAG: hypothetical protein ABL891_01075 [Burkholderiales bacterium]
MGKQRDLYANWKRAKQQLDAVFEQPEHSVVVHYSCESFYDRDNNPRSPRVTSIAVRNLDSGQTKSFSIHLIAERRGLLDSIERHYDQLEREMLKDFCDDVRVRQHCKWIHWNMRDSNYGFEALENRMKTLGDTPVSVPEANRYDLSRLLVSIYGTGYVGHPRLEKLMTLNHVTPRDFLTGAQEAAAFEEKQFVKLHQSTLRKVDVLANLAGRAHAGDLKTLASWWEVNGRSIKAIGEWLREHWLIGALVAIAGIVSKVAGWWPAISGHFGG